MEGLEIQPRSVRIWRCSEEINQNGWSDGEGSSGGFFKGSSHALHYKIQRRVTLGCGTMKVELLVEV